MGEHSTEEDNPSHRKTTRHRRGFRALIGTLILISTTALAIYFDVASFIWGAPSTDASVTLILVDIQKDFWTEEVAVDFPDFQRNVADLVQTCRDAGVEVVHVRTQYDPKIVNWSASFVPVHHSGKLCERGTEGAEPLACARDVRGEQVFIKGRMDAFQETILAEHLKKSRTQDVLVAGLYTEVCVLTTALAAFNHGYRVTVVSDCCASRRSSHEFVINRYDGFILNCLPLAAVRSVLATKR